MPERWPDMIAGMTNSLASLLWGFGLFMWYVGRVAALPLWEALPMSGLPVGVLLRWSLAKDRRHRRLKR